MTLNSHPIDHTTPALLAELGSLAAEAITAECVDFPRMRLIEVEARMLQADTIAHDHQAFVRRQARRAA